MSFEFTQKRAALVDEPNKKKYQERTGYDYNSPGQTTIRKYVIHSLDMALLRGRGIDVTKKLLPGHGVLTLRGVFERELVTKQDLEAFSAAYPQVAATGSRRIQITEILESGNSITQEGAPPESNKVDTTNPGPPEEVNNSSPNSQDVATSTDSEYKIRILERVTQKVLQIKRFKDAEEYRAWFSRSDITSRINAIVASAMEGYKQDISFPSQKTKDQHIEYFKSPNNRRPDKIKARILDSGFYFKRAINLPSADYLSWLESEYDNIDFVINSTEQGYNFDIRYNEERETETTEDELTFSPEELMYTPPYPPNPSEPTHEVYAPSVWILEKPDEDSEILQTLNRGEKIIVIDDAVSSNGQMCEILYEGIPAYVDSSFIKKLPQTPEGAVVDFNEPKNFSNSKNTTPWNRQRHMIPYYDPYDAKCKVAIRTPYKNLKHKETPEESIQDIYKDQISVGVKSILDEFGKVSGDEQVSFLITENPFYHNLARVEDYYLDLKSESRLQVLVTLPHKYLYLIDDKSDETNYEVVREYRVSTFREKTRKVQKMISSHKKTVDSFEGEIKYYDPEEESLRVSMLPNAIYELFKSNDIKVKEGKNSSERFYIGWIGREIEYVSHLSGDQTETIMKKGMNKFKKKVEISSERTQDILVNLDEIVKSGPKMNWREFVYNYINYNVVSIEDKTNVKNLGEKEGQVEMSRDDKLKEDKYYGNKERRKDLLKKRKIERDNTKNPKKYNSFSDVQKRMGEELDDVYKNVVNNFDISKIAMSALDCIQSNPLISFDDGFLEVDGVDFDGIFGDIIKLKEGFEGLYDDTVGFITKVYKDPTKIFYFSDLPTDDIIESFITGLGDQLEEMAKALLVSLVTSLLGAITNLCETPDADEMGPVDAQDLLEDLRPNIDEVNDLIKDGQDDNSEAVEDLILDLAARLSLTEFCKLLAGNPTDATLDIISQLVDEKYCELGLDSPAKIIEFFKNIGEISTYPLCLREEIPPEKFGPALSPWENLCPPEDQKLGLVTKGLSEAQVTEQVEKEKERLKKLAEEILDAFENGPLSGKQEAPPLFCTKDENGNVKPGTASFMDPTFSEEIRTTVETLVKPVYETFQKEGREYSSSLIGFKEVDGEVPELVDLPFGDPQIIMRNAKVRKRVVLPELDISYRSGNFVRFDSLPFEEGERFDTSADTTVNDCFHIPMGNTGELKETLEELKKMEQQLENVPTSPVFGIDMKSAMQSRLSHVKNKMNEARDALDEKVILRIKDPCQQERKSQTIYNLAKQLRPVEPRLNVSVNQNNPNPEYKEECEKVNSFANLPIIHFMDGRSRSQITSPEVDLTQMQKSDFASLGSPGFDDACESEKYLTYEIETVEKTYSYRKEIDNLSYATMLNTPYTKDEGKLRRHSFFHQLIKTQLNAASDQQSLDNNTSKSAMSSIYNKLNKEVLTKIRQDILSNSYTKEVSFGEQQGSEENAQYMIELVDLGPNMTPECDPHLLRLKDLSDEVLSNFQEDYCVTLDSGGGQKTPIQKSVMRACVRATLRHYLIDFYARGMFTAAAFRDDTSSRIIFEFITDKIISEMMKYSLSYSKDFTRELVLLDSEEAETENVEIDDATVRDAFTRMLDKEYKIIKKGFQESLLIDRKKLPSLREAIADSYANRTISIDSEGEVEFDESIEDYITETAENLEELDKLGQNDALDILRRGFKFDFGKPIFRVCVQYYEEKTGKYYNRQEALDFLYNDIIFSGENTSFKNFQMITSFVCIVPSHSEEYDSMTDFPGFKQVQEFGYSRTDGLWYNYHRPSKWSALDTSTYIYPIIQRRDNVMIPSPEAEEVAKRLLFTEDNHRTKMLFDYSIPLDDYYSTFLIHEIESNSRISSIVLAFGETRDELYNLFYSVLPRGDYWNRNPKALEGLPPNLAAIFSLNFNPFNTPCIDLKWNFGLPGIKWGNPFKGINFSFAWKAALNMSLMIFKEWVRKNDPNIILAQKLSFLLSLACINISEKDISTVLGIPYLTNPYMMNAYNTAYNYLGLGDFDVKLSLGSDDKDKVVQLMQESGFSLPDYCKIEEEAQGGVPIESDNPESTNQLIRDLMPNDVTGDLTVSEVHELRIKVTTLNGLRLRDTQLTRQIDGYRYRDTDERWDNIGIIFRDGSDIENEQSRHKPSRRGNSFDQFPYREEFKQRWLANRDQYYLAIPVELRHQLMRSWVIPRMQEEESRRKQGLATRNSYYVRVNFLYGPDSKLVTQDEFIQEYSDIVGPSTQVSQTLWSEDHRLTEAARSGISMDDYIDLVSIDTRDTENDIVYWNWHDGPDAQSWGLKQYRLLPQYKEELDPLIIERASVRQQMKRLEDELYGEFYNNA